MKLMIVLALAVLVVWFVFEGPEINMSGVSDAVKQLPEELSRLGDGVSEDGAFSKFTDSDTIYSWVDAQGDRQYSNQPPPADAKDVVIHEYRPDTNVIPMKDQATETE